MAGGEAMITEAHLSDDFLEDACAARRAPRRPQPRRGRAAPAPPPAHPRRAARTLEEIEIDDPPARVDEAGGNISVASKRLGISRNTIYRKLRWNQPA